MNKAERQILRDLRTIFTSLDGAIDVRRRDTRANRKIDDLSLDSICLVEACSAVHAKWGVELDIFDFPIDATFGDVAHRVYELQQSKLLAPA